MLSAISHVCVMIVMNWYATPMYQPIGRLHMLSEVNIYFVSLFRNPHTFSQQQRNASNRRASIGILLLIIFLTAFKGWDRYEKKSAEFRYASLCETVFLSLVCTDRPTHIDLYVFASHTLAFKCPIAQYNGKLCVKCSGLINGNDTLLCTTHTRTSFPNMMNLPNDRKPKSRRIQH